MAEADSGFIWKFIAPRSLLLAYCLSRWIESHSVLADGFYEWRKDGKGKTPVLFKLASGEPFTFAGLWDAWRKPDSSTLRTFTIITRIALLGADFRENHSYEV